MTSRNPLLFFEGSVWMYDDGLLFMLVDDDCEHRTYSTFRVPPCLVEQCQKLECGDFVALVSEFLTLSDSCYPMLSDIIVCSNPDVDTALHRYCADRGGYRHVV